MAKRIDTQARIEAVRLQDQGSPPAAPTAGYSLVFAKADGLYLETSAGAIVGPFITGTASSGGRTLIEEKTPSGTGTISFSSIPNTYKNLVLEFAIRSTQATAFVSGKLGFNGDASGTNYRSVNLYEYGAGGSANINGEAGANMEIAAHVVANSAPANEFTVGIIEIPQYANSNINKQAFFRGSSRRDNSSVFLFLETSVLTWVNVSAINQIDIALTLGNYAANTVFRLYGEN